MSGKEPKYKVGDKARVVDKSKEILLYPHGFEIGATVEITEVDDFDNTYKCIKSGEVWWLPERDLSPIEEQTNLVAEEQTAELEVNFVNHFQLGNYTPTKKKGYKEGLWDALNWFCKQVTEEQSEQENNWVKTADRTPQESGRYWCYVKELNDLGFSYYQLNLAYNKEENRWSLDAGNQVTHWMLLPESPIELLPVQASVASKDHSSTFSQDNNSEKTMTSKDHSSLKEGEGFEIEIDQKKVIAPNRYITGLGIKNLIRCDLTYGVWIKNYPEPDKELHDNEQADLKQPGRQQFFTGSRFTTEGAEPKEQVSNTDWKEEIKKASDNYMNGDRLRRNSWDFEAGANWCYEKLELQLREAKEMYSKSAEMFKKSMGQLNQENEDLLKVNSERNKENIALRQENQRLKNLLAEAEQK